MHHEIDVRFQKYYLCCLIGFCSFHKYMISILLLLFYELSFTNIYRYQISNIKNEGQDEL